MGLDEGEEVANEVLGHGGEVEAEGVTVALRGEAVPGLVDEDVAGLGGLKAKALNMEVLEETKATTTRLDLLGVDIAGGEEDEEELGRSEGEDGGGRRGGPE